MARRLQGARMTGLRSTRSGELTKLVRIIGWVFSFEPVQRRFRERSPRSGKD
jgi:hypothetical protein